MTTLTSLRAMMAPGGALFGCGEEYLRNRVLAALAEETEPPLDETCHNCGFRLRYSETDTYHNHRCPAPANDLSAAPLDRKPGLYIVFDGPPSHESGRFVEVEDETGRSVHAADWHNEGSFWALGPFAAPLDVERLAEAILAARSTTARWKGSARATEPTQWDRLMAKRVLNALADRLEAGN